MSEVQLQVVRIKLTMFLFCVLKAQGTGADLRQEHLQLGELHRQSDNRIGRDAEHTGREGSSREAAVATAGTAAAATAAAHRDSDTAHLIRLQLDQQGFKTMHLFIVFYQLCISI